MIAIALDKICVRLGHRWILAHVELELEQGRRLLISGDNGAGKTTLLRVMATALAPALGQVTLFGQLAAGPQLAQQRRRLALVTHQHYFYEPLSAYQNLALVARLMGVLRAERIAWLLAHVGLQQAAGRAVATFSAGMKRRLSLARALLLEPELVLLDEPFAALDAHGCALMEQALVSWADQGATVVMVSHDLERAKKLCPLEAKLVDGRLLWPSAKAGDS